MALKVVHFENHIKSLTHNNMVSVLFGSRPPFLAGGATDFSLSWSYCVQKSVGICLDPASGVLVRCQRLHPNAEQISRLITVKTPPGSVSAAIKICAGRGSWQDNSGIQVSKHNPRPELCSWHHRSAGLISRKSIPSGRTDDETICLLVEKRCCDDDRPPWCQHTLRSSVTSLWWIMRKEWFWDLGRGKNQFPASSSFSVCRWECQVQICDLILKGHMYMLTGTCGQSWSTRDDTSLGNETNPGSSLVLLSIKVVKWEKNRGNTDIFKSSTRVSKCLAWGQRLSCYLQVQLHIVRLGSVYFSYFKLN